MSVYILDDELWFPPVGESTDDGLLAVGGDLTPGRLLLAYRSGIFPWFGDDDPPMWWSPDPRFVLFPGELKVSKSMKQVLKKQEFSFTTNKAFDEVIQHCSEVDRKGQYGTWIVNEVIDGYRKMHRIGYAHSAEAWVGNELVGGLYGILLGKVFFGESMFSLRTNASKFAFICWVEALKTSDIRLIDCQVYTPHLESLGARMIPRNDFMEILAEYVG